MKSRKEFYNYYVFQPDRRGIWIHKVSGQAAGCRQFLAAVKKLFPNAFYKAAYSPILPAPLSVSYMDGGGDLFKIEHYYITFLEEDRNAI